MKMTNKLANELMDNLACVAISALGIPQTEEEFNNITEYARSIFTNILTTWEESLGEKWEIEEDEENPSKSNDDYSYFSYNPFTEEYGWDC